MDHLILPLRHAHYADAVDALKEALAFLVGQARTASIALVATRPRWGIRTKRELVDLKREARPRLIGKDSERLVEVINMAATLERTVDALTWFSSHPAFRALVILECHPSTSSTPAGNDLVLGEVDGAVRVRCEVTDVASNSAAQNVKEKRDLKNLGGATTVPDDNIRRFICTSAEFAAALASDRRRWASYHYRYRTHAPQIDDTALLEIVAPGTESR